MDTPTSKNGSYLVFAVGIVAVIALVVAILALVRINKLTSQLGTSNIAGLTVRMDTVEANAKKASDDAGKAATRVTGLSTDTQRAFDQVATELASLRTSVNKVVSDTKSINDRLTASPVRSPAPAPTTTTAPTPGSGGGVEVSSAPAPGTLADDGTYVIKAGDTLSTIGREFGMSYVEIQAVNPGLDPRKLRVGQKIYIPKKQ